MFCPRTATRNGVSAARHSRKSLADQGSEKTARSIAVTATTSAGWAGRIRQGAAMASLPFRLGLGRPTIHWLGREGVIELARRAGSRDRKSTRLNSSHLVISYAVFCLKKKKKKKNQEHMRSS